MNANENLEWVDIPGYEGYYQINRNGDVKKLATQCFSLDGSDKRVRREKILSRNSFCRGYRVVGLRKEGIQKQFYVYKLLAKTFIPNPNKYPVVRHLNDIRTDDRIENLRWGTYSENTLDALKNGGLVPIKGEKHPFFGKRGAETNQYGKRGLNATNNKMVLDLETGIYYYNSTEAAKAKNFNKDTLQKKLAGQYKNNTSLIYV